MSYIFNQYLPRNVFKYCTLAEKKKHSKFYVKKTEELGFALKFLLVFSSLNFLHLQTLTTFEILYRVQWYITVNFKDVNSQKVRIIQQGLLI